MMILRNAAAIAVLLAPLCLTSAFAQDEMKHDMGTEEMMHHDMNVTCDVSDMGEMGMTVTFHNMGDAEIPAGTKGHWMVRGVAQGDVNFMEAVGPKAMKEQMYMTHEMVHGSASAPCSVDVM